MVSEQDERDWSELIKKTLGGFRSATADNGPDEHGGFNGSVQFEHDELPPVTISYVVYPPRSLWQGKMKPEVEIHDQLWTLVQVTQTQDGEELTDTSRAKHIYELYLNDPYDPDDPFY